MSELHSAQLQKNWVTPRLPQTINIQYRNIHTKGYFKRSSTCSEAQYHLALPERRPCLRGKKANGCRGATAPC